MRKEFKFIENNIYFDSAALCLKPKVVLDQIISFYEETPINPHSYNSGLSEKVQKVINETRTKTAELVDSKTDEVIFTSGTTASLNLLVNMLNIKKGDQILLSNLNHSSNMAPWLKKAKEIGAEVIFTNNLIDKINSKTKYVSFSQINNTLDEHIDIKKLYKKCQKFNVILINDAAQAIVHEKVSLKNSDVIVFSSNKLYGPTGLGLLIIKEKLLSTLEPFFVGGGSILEIKNNSYINKTDIRKWESGTLNLAGIFGFNKALDFFKSFHNQDYLKELNIYLFDKLSKLAKIKIYSKRGDNIFLFNIDGVFPEDVAHFLGKKNIFVRSGEHCAKLLKEEIEVKYTLRISLNCYNNKKEIDKLFEILNNEEHFF